MFMHAGKPMRGQSQPTRDAVAGLPQLRVSRHPVVAHKLTILRDMTTDSATFRHAMTDLTVCLAYEALAEMRSTPTRVQTPLEETEGTMLGERFAIVPVLRAGLGMVDGFLALFPSLQVWHIGLYRDEASLQPVTYYNRLPGLATVDTLLRPRSDAGDGRQRRQDDCHSQRVGSAQHLVRRHYRRALWRPAACGRASRCLDPRRRARPRTQ